MIGNLEELNTLGHEKHPGSQVKGFFGSSMFFSPTRLPPKKPPPSLLLLGVHPAGHLVDVQGGHVGAQLSDLNHGLRKRTEDQWSGGSGVVDGFVGVVFWGRLVLMFCFF